jgi:protein TonB
MLTSFTIDTEIQPIFRGQPLYPVALLDRGIEGNCRTLFDVGTNGTPYNIQLNCTNRGFERSAHNAIARWKYSPKIVDGVPVPMRGVTNSISFRIEKD